MSEKALQRKYRVIPESDPINFHVCCPSPREGMRVIYQLVMGIEIIADQRDLLSSCVFYSLALELFLFGRFMC
jgi:hypothetical protein